MKKLMLLTVAAVLIFTQVALAAGKLDKLKSSDVEAMPAGKLEKMYLLDYCENAECDFGYTSANSSKLTKAERMAVWHYTLGFYEKLTPALYKNDLTGSQTAMVRLMDSGLRKIKNYNGVIYRGTYQSEKLVKGQIVTPKAFQSASPNRFVAEGFITDRLMIIQSKSGKDIQEYSNDGMETEVLLPRLVNLRVDNVRYEKMLLGDDPAELREVNVEVVNYTEI